MTKRPPRPEGTQGTSAPKRRALLITHGPNPPCDYVSAALGRRGFARDWRCLPKGHALPAPDPDLYDLVVVYGGPQLLSDLQPGEEYLLEEVAWARTFVEAGGRFLGLCLGAQILAKAFGAKVWRHGQGHREVGFYPIQATQAGQASADLPANMMVYHWHRDGFDLPEGATLLATGHMFPNQAYSLGPRTLAVQFHPEITDGMIANWAERAPEDADQAPGAQSRTTHLSGYGQHQARVHAWIEGQLDALLAA